MKLRKTTTRIILVLLALLATPILCHAEPSPTRGAWMKQAKFGIFIHFLGGGDGWNKRVDSFDVKGVAQQAAAAKADYLVLTLGQNSGYYCSPNKTYDTIVGVKAGEKCSHRDLPMELAKELKKHNIRLLLYLPSRAPNQDRAAMKALQENDQYKPAPQAFTENWSKVIREWSMRYGNLVSGWWFDGAYNTAGWDDPNKKNNWNTWAAACRAGNPDSVLTFNPGTRIDKAYARLTTQQDYTAGEQNHWKHTPSSQPAAPGLQWHILSFLGSTWGKSDGPKLSNEQMIAYVRQVNSQGGIVSIDVGINKTTGLICAKHYQQLKYIGSQTRP